MDNSVEQQIRVRAERALVARVFPGCVIGIIQRGNSMTPVSKLYTEVIATGTIDGVVPVAENTIYDVASITKSIPVASLALALMGEGRLWLENKVKEYLPELQNDYGATIEDLLRYRVAGVQISSLKMRTPEEIRTHVLEHGFDGPSGNGAYTNLPAFLLGLIVERATGEILPALANRYFFEPLGMHDTTFFPSIPDASISTGRQILMRADNRIAPTEIVDGIEISGIVHDESARVFARARKAVGHAGLFSTAPDLLKFLEALLHLGHPMSYVVEGAQKGLGWEKGAKWMGEKGTNAFGKTGFTGTSILCDVEKGIGLVILSNRTYPHRPPDNSAINAFRKDVADIVLA